MLPKEITIFHHHDSHPTTTVLHIARRDKQSNSAMEYSKATYLFCRWCDSFCHIHSREPTQLKTLTYH